MQDNPPDEQNPDEAQIISGAEALADQALAAHDGAEPGELSLGLGTPDQQFLTPSPDPTMAGGEEGALLEGEPALDPSDPTTDPNLSVDELLSEAVAADGAFEAPLVPNLPAPSGPTFQLHLRGLSDELRPALKKLLEAQGLSLPEKSAGAPVVSQLSEYQAVLLLQGARALGCEASGNVMLPTAAPTEDDLALGDLLAVPEAAAGEALRESAPSVALPTHEKDVMLCSPVQMPGVKTVESFGIVIAHRSIARRLFREEDLKDKLERELKAVPGRGAAALASSHLQQLLRDLLLDLRKAALAKGANSVVGVKLEAFPESSTLDPQLEQLRLVAFGTAALVEKA